jgi:putative nucleotidyltransferase with HDIG domain
MQKQNPNAITIATTIALVILGQLFLFAPHLGESVTGEVSSTTLFWLGLGFLLFGQQLTNAILLQLSERVQGALHLFAGILFLWFSFHIFRLGYTVEFFILFFIALLNLFAYYAHSKPGTKVSFLNFPFFGKLILGFITGIILITNPMQENVLLPSASFEINRAIGWIFEGMVLLGLIRFTSWFSPSWEQFLSIVMAAPWAIWTIILFPANNWVALIPAISATAFIALPDESPLEQFKFPRRSRFGWAVIAGFTVLYLSTALVVSYILSRSGAVVGATMGALPAIETAQIEQDFLAIKSIVFYSFLLISIFFPVLIAASSFGLRRIMDEINALAEAISQRRINRPSHSFDDPASLVDLIASSFLRVYQTAQDYGMQTNPHVTEISSLLEVEKSRTAQLSLVSKLQRELEQSIDFEEAAEITAESINNFYKDCRIAVLKYDEAKEELEIVANHAGEYEKLPPNIRVSIHRGVIGRAARTLKTQIVNNPENDPDFYNILDDQIKSELAVPLVQNDYLQGVIDISNRAENLFVSADIATVETIGEQLLAAWERARYRQNLTKLIRSGVNLSQTTDPEQTLKQISEITRDVLDAEFTIATLLDQNQNLTITAASGDAPQLYFTVMNQGKEAGLFAQVLNSTHPLDIPNVKSHPRGADLILDRASLHSGLGFPIRLHGLSIGAVMAFGKKSGAHFTENDVSLAILIGAQGAAAMESAWLYEELQSSLNITTLLNQLSVRITKSETLDQAAVALVEIAGMLTQATTSGIVLFSAEGEMRAQLQVDENGPSSNGNYPEQLVSEVMASGKEIHAASEDNGSQTVCYPIESSARRYGVIWLKGDGSSKLNSNNSTHIHILINQAAVALDRSFLFEDSRSQARELAVAYGELESAYDQTLVALINALDARDNVTEGHSLRVSAIAKLLGLELGLADKQLQALEHGALLHDIGKIGVSDAILHKPGPLTDEEWALMRKHPEIGAQIIKDIPFFESALPVIQFHQERWDGSGYPHGLKDEQIPLLARIFAVADAFDAMTSFRPYRTKVAKEEALAYLKEQAGIQFDTKVVDAIIAIAPRLGDAKHSIRN